MGIFWDIQSNNRDLISPKEVLMVGDYPQGSMIQILIGPGENGKKHQSHGEMSQIMLNLYLLEGKTNYCWLTMQFTYHSPVGIPHCILQNSYYNHVKVNIAPTKSPQIDSCTCLGFTTIVFCFNLQHFSIYNPINIFL